MIEETKKKIHFLPYTVAKGRSRDTDAPPTVTVSPKFGKIIFGKKVITETGMQNQFVRLYYEPQRKIIGWRVKDSVVQEEMKLWKLCRPAQSNGAWTMTITKMLAEMPAIKADSYKNLPVQKYRELDKFTNNSGEVFYFVELKANDEPHDD